MKNNESKLLNYSLIVRHFRSSNSTQNSQLPLPKKKPKGKKIINKLREPEERGRERNVQVVMAMRERGPGQVECISA